MCENITEFTDTVDPRVHIELERLNNATDEINKLEVELDEARTSFRQLLCESTTTIEGLRLKLGLCVERAKPYYEARFYANEISKQTQTAAMRYEKANSAHSAAREMVYLAEQGLGGRTLDSAWQEMLNHATQRVNDAEIERGMAGTAHRIMCVKLEASNTRVQNLQKELKRAITKSSLSIRRSLMTMNSIACRHELMLLPYYEMKAHFNNLLEQQKQKVQNLESEVSKVKFTYADALKNLEHISDEIHQSRNKANKAIERYNNQTTVGSNEVIIENLGQCKSFPCNFTELSVTACTDSEEESYKNVCIENNVALISPKPQSDDLDRIQTQIGHSQSSEWTEINLDISSPEDEIPYKKFGDTEEKPKLTRQKTMPNPVIENEYASIKNKIKLDTNISSWISKSSANQNYKNSSRRQSLENILGPTGEKVKDIFTYGMMMLNIGSITDRRNSEPKLEVNEDKHKATGKKTLSPLEKTFSYLNIEDDNSDTESLSSVDMLNEEQINSLMLDKEINEVCEQVLGTPISEVVALPSSSVESSNKR